jgi:cytosine/adenosine deaminase-related metal-dependent hydrolase
MTVLRARWILAHDGSGHRLLEDGEVRIDADRIVSVGRASGAGAADAIELGDALLMPGFIDLDALSDIDHAILDSWQPGAGARRLQWSQRHAEDPDRRHVLTPDERATMRRFAFAQLLLHGVTTAMPIASEVHSDWAETFDDAVRMAAEAEMLGLRVFLGPSFRSGVPVVGDDDRMRIQWEPARGDDGLDDAVRFVEWAREHDSPLVQGVLLPCRIETLTDALLERIASAADRLDVLVRLHCLQGLDELRLLRERGTTPLDLLERVGLLTDRLLIPHGIYTDENPRVGAAGGGSMHRIVDAGSTVIHCPLTSAHYATALDTFDSYRQAGVRLALGTDSFPPDMLRGIDVGSSVAKILEARLDAGAHGAYIEAATLGGAHALRRPDLGRIAPGATADVIAIRLDDVRDGVVDDPIRTAVQHTTARAVDFSMVGGRTCVRGGRLVGTDMQALAREAQSLFGKLRAGYGDRTQTPTTASDLFPATFPAWEEPTLDG